eukprot:6492443-Amphidinium_carterae.2
MVWQSDALAVCFKLLSLNLSRSNTRCLSTSGSEWCRSTGSEKTCVTREEKVLMLGVYFLDSLRSGEPESRGHPGVMRTY